MNVASKILLLLILLLILCVFSTIHLVSFCLLSGHLLDLDKVSVDKVVH